MVRSRSFPLRPLPSTLAFVGLLLLLAGFAADAPAVEEPCPWVQDDAAILAIESGFGPLPPAGVVEAIDDDLRIIRGTLDRFADYHAVRNWGPGMVSLRVELEDFDRIVAREHEEIEALNAEFGLTVLGETRRSSFGATVRFCGDRPLDTRTVVARYEEIGSVRYADSGYGPITGDPPRNVWKVGDHLYRFRLGWGDCPAGCIEEAFWIVSVEDGVARIVETEGNVSARTSSWSTLKAEY